VEQNSGMTREAQDLPLLKDELNLFLIALTFLTRIPYPGKIDYSPRNLNRASRYFPWVGLLVGGIGALVLWISMSWVPQSLAVLLSMLVTILLTGAFHEDGLADTCDGFGGGWTKEQVLTIMKDSRLGTYGTIGLLAVLAIKAQSLMLLSLDNALWALLVGHVVSRWVAVSFLLDLDYVRDIDSSKVKPLAERMTAGEFARGLVITLPLLIWLPWTLTLLLITVMLVMRMLFKKLLLRKLGGFTGDCLGAAQQISEVLIYVCWVAYS